MITLTILVLKREERSAEKWCWMPAMERCSKIALNLFRACGYDVVEPFCELDGNFLTARRIRLSRLNLGGAM